MQTFPLTWEEVEGLDLNKYTKEEILYMVRVGILTKEDVAHYYRNDQWEDDV